MPKKARKINKQGFGVLLEDMDSKLDMIAEGHTVLDKKIDDFRHETRTEVNMLKFGQRIISDTQKDFAVRSERNFDEIKTEIAALKPLLVRKSDLEQVVNLEKRVARLEKVTK